MSASSVEGRRPSRRRTSMMWRSTSSTSTAMTAVYHQLDGQSSRLPTVCRSDCQNGGRLIVQGGDGAPPRIDVLAPLLGAAEEVTLQVLDLDDAVAVVQE